MCSICLMLTLFFVPHPTEQSNMQGSFWKCAQPMRDNITLQHHLSLAGCIQDSFTACTWCGLDPEMSFMIFHFRIWIQMRGHHLTFNTNHTADVSPWPHHLWTKQWLHNERSGISNHRCLDCLLNHLLRRRSKKTSKLPITGLCEGNPPVTGGFPSQMASNAENVSIWWRRHEFATWWKLQGAHQIVWNLSQTQFSHSAGRQTTWIDLTGHDTDMLKLQFV